MKCSHFNFKVDPEKVLFTEQEIEKLQNEGIKGSEIIDKITKQESLKKWKNPQVKQPGTYFCYWLDPIQSEIMDDSNPYQIIVGPASTGKTVLIQQKAYQILQKDTSTAILIILPLNILKMKYIQFFKDSGFMVINKVFVMTIEEDWKTVIKAHNPHVFIDEFAAIQSMEEGFLNKILELARKHQQLKGICNRLIWLAIDFHQSYDILTLGLPQVEDKEFIERASKRHLLLVHRCTIQVFKVLLIL